MEYILHVEKTDDITSIRSRIERLLATIGTPTPAGKTLSAKRRRVLVVLPRQNKTFHNLVNAKLLARFARTKALEIGLVSNSPVVRDNTKTAELKAFASMQAAKRFGWLAKSAPQITPDQTLPPVYIPPSTNGPDIEDTTTKAPLSRKTRKYYEVLMGDRIGCVQQIVALILAGILAIAFVMGLVMLLPQATVTITPVAKPLTTDLTVRGDPTVDEINYATLTFPARVDQVDLSLYGQVDTIEAEFAPAGLAVGNVTFINRTDVFQSIPPSTTLVTGSGDQVEFTTRITAELAAGVNARATVPVIAKQRGPVGNVGAGQITRFVDPTYGVAVRVINEVPLGGGTFEMTAVVVNDDKLRLRDHLIEKMKIEGLKRLEEELGEQEFISPDTLQVIPLAITFKEFSGDFSPTFSGEMQAAVRGTVVAGYEANKLALAGLEAQVPLGYELGSKGLHFGAGEVLNAEEGVIIFRIVASGLAVPMIESHAVADEIAWQSIGEAQAYLQDRYELATVPGVELEPAWLVDWLGRLPYSPVRINVMVKDALVLLEDMEQEP